MIAKMVTQKLRLVLAFTLGVVATIVAVSMIGAYAAVANLSSLSSWPNMVDGMMQGRVTNRNTMGDMMDGMTMNNMAGMMNQMMGSMNMSNTMQMTGMMGPIMGGPYNSDVKPITIDQALTNARKYVSSFNNTDLAIAELEEYSNNFYVAVLEKSTRNFAFQLLVDRFTGAVYPEPGPNMMWNTKYGGMMSYATSTQMPISKDQAKQIAQKFLDSYLSGARVGDFDTFHGYYNAMVLVDGEKHGMLSINGFNGEVWYHIWHGTFIRENRLI